ncbi:hypothetical protein [Sphingopyxis sp. MG]|uniref:hypothetical protein n=1 Tax=Sphingopyxis sp. MG TaxID=1866325 RepID=UPI000CDF5000|nr:hypothetical protein [Sphingopyxis sp. MG]AVA13629.1 hypothetical protein C3E99_07055 [Sphingopyxis sp. MG]
MEIDLVRAVELAFATILLAIFAFRIAVGTEQRLILLGLLGGFLVYSGIGTTYTDVPPYLMVSYFVGSLAMMAGFALGKTVFARMGEIVGTKSVSLFDRIGTRVFAYSFIAAIIVIKLINLVYPEFKLDQFVRPPAPDITNWFNARFEIDETVFEKIIRYFEILITPFFYVALYFFRRNLFLLVTVIFVIRYMEYIDVAYIARGTVVSDLLIISLITWQERKEWRPFLMIGALISLPMILYLLGQYSVARMGGYYQGSGVFDGALNVLREETSFLSQGGTLVIESGQHVNMPSYLTWIATLPIPDFLRQGLPVALVNYEISTLVIGRQPGDPGFYVSLTGLLAESYYLFGPIFFWVHGLFCGFLAAMFARICERVPYYRILSIYVAVIFLHNLNRGGIASVMPGLTNGFLAFYLFLFIIPSIWWRQKPASTSDTWVSKQ